MNSLKKTLYDAYLDDAAKGAGQDEKTYVGSRPPDHGRP